MKKMHPPNLMQQGLCLAWLILSLLLTGCGSNGDRAVRLEVPKGYLAVIEIEIQDRLLTFGPFVGYYFKPARPGSFSDIEFVCFNEKNFYTRDMPENSLLFRGEAVLTTLPEVDPPGLSLTGSHRIHPIFFKTAPPEWLRSRPLPRDEYVHFHSCHDARGPVLTGYWLRHWAVAAFNYDMGRRVDKESPLYHRVEPGADRGFASIIEFDRGPDMPPVPGH